MTIKEMVKGDFGTLKEALIYVKENLFYYIEPPEYVRYTYLHWFKEALEAVQIGTELGVCTIKRKVNLKSLIAKIDNLIKETYNDN